MGSDLRNIFVGWFMRLCGVLRKVGVLNVAFKPPHEHFWCGYGRFWRDDFRGEKVRHEYEIYFGAVPVLGMGWKTRRQRRAGSGQRPDELLVAAARRG